MEHDSVEPIIVHNVVLDGNVIAPVSATDNLPRKQGSERRAGRAGGWGGVPDQTLLRHENSTRF